MGGLTLDLRPGAGLGAFNLGNKFIYFAFLELLGDEFQLGVVGFFDEELWRFKSYMFLCRLQ